MVDLWCRVSHEKWATRIGFNYLPITVASTLLVFVGEDMKLSQAQVLAQLTKPVTVPETEIKRKIMDNYGFVDTDHDIKYHRPIVSKKGVSEQ